MEKVNLLPTNEDSQYYQQHIAGRHGKGSTTIGSKLLEDVSDKFMLNLLKETDKAYQAAIDEKVHRDVWCLRWKQIDLSEQMLYIRLKI